MIIIKYKELFDLEILHSFYISGKCPDVELIPSAACKILLQTFGLRFLPTTFGGKVFAKVTSVGENDFIKNPLPADTKLIFLLRLKNRLFENFSSLDLNKPANNHYYFNNLVNNISADGLPLLAADTATKIVSNADLLSFATNSFSFTHTNVAPVQNSSLQFIDNGEQFDQQLNNHNDTFNFTYDLQKTLGGRARFTIEGVDKILFYTLQTADAANIFGVVEIFHNTTLNNAYKFQLADNSIVSKFYKIPFGNRLTRWRYVITKKFNQNVTGVTVAKTNGSPIAFSSFPGPPAGQFIMTSDTVLPLKEEPVTGIKLSDQLNNSIITNLPNPALGLVTQDGANIFSDILITI